MQHQLLASPMATNGYQLGNVCPNYDGTNNQHQVAIGAFWLVRNHCEISYTTIEQVIEHQYPFNRLFKPCTKKISINIHDGARLTIHIQDFEG